MNPDESKEKGNILFVNNRLLFLSGDRNYKAEPLILQALNGSVSYIIV